MFCKAKHFIPHRLAVTLRATGTHEKSPLLLSAELCYNKENNFTQKERETMRIDITLPVTPKMLGPAWDNTDKSLTGHLGTHFDVMDREFPLDYTCRRGVAFDVSHVRDRDIGVEDVDLERVERDSFVALYTGYIREVAYGTADYFKYHPQLSHALIDALLDRGVSVIGLDCAGIRRAPEHVPADRRCARQGTFVVENLWGLDVLAATRRPFTVHTYPMRITGITGLPCRVVAELEGECEE